MNDPMIPVTSDASAPSSDNHSQAETQVSINIPLITAADESSFEDIVAVSRQVPVVLVIWGAASLESRPTIDVLEDLTRENAGAFQLITIDADTSPNLVRALQIQALPTVVALVAGRPLPLFQGSASKEQIRPLLEELVQAAQQLGLSARIAVAQEDIAPVIPEEHLPALELEKEGDLEGAAVAWEKVLDLFPRDEAAKGHLARVRLAIRGAAQVDEEAALTPEERADALFSQGKHVEAFEILLNILASHLDEDARDAARVRLLDLFRIAGNTPEVSAARKRLSTLLMI